MVLQDFPPAPLIMGFFWCGISKVGVGTHQTLNSIKKSFRETNKTKLTSLQTQNTI